MNFFLHHYYYLDLVYLMVLLKVKNMNLMTYLSQSLIILSIVFFYVNKNRICNSVGFQFRLLKAKWVEVGVMESE
jgi:hypothetical protein